MKKLFLFTLAALTICSCSESGTEDDPKPESVVTDIDLSPDNLIFEVQGGTKSVRISLKYSGAIVDAEWQLTGGEPWCAPSQTEGGDNGQVAFEATENTGFEERNATFTFTCGEISKELVVSQQPTDGDAIIEFEDPRFLEALLAEGVDQNGDGRISKKEAAAPVSLDVSSREIRTMDEIRYFTALVELYCNKNQLTSLDVSNNVALTYLECFGNQLTSLDFSNNADLRVLKCSGNQLTSLDVSSNADLKHLECNVNRLTSLDVSNNPALERLLCGNNQLTSLDISNNPALERLDCGDNQLVSLDISRNTALTYLDCSHNQLTSLDIGNNLALEHLFCVYNQLTSLDISNNSALEQLRCADNQLTSLDISNNTELLYLYCGSNQLTSLDINKCRNLINLSCSGNPLTSLLAYKYHHPMVQEHLNALIAEYGDIVTYVE